MVCLINPPHAACADSADLVTSNFVNSGIAEEFLDGLQTFLFKLNASFGDMTGTFL